MVGQGKNRAAVIQVFIYNAGRTHLSLAFRCVSVKICFVLLENLPVDIPVGIKNEMNVPGTHPLRSGSGESARYQ
jgi:hypothetical protein